MNNSELLNKIDAAIAEKSLLNIRFIRIGRPAS